MRIQSLRLDERRLRPRAAVPPAPSALSRRRFLRSAGGAALAGTMLGSGLWRPGSAFAHRAHAANHIPGGSPVIEGFFGSLFHVWGPGAIDPPDAEPSTITDFDGEIGLAFISGDVTRTNTNTGTQEVLPFVESDMRFMDGVFRGTDGKVHNGTFAFI